MHNKLNKKYFKTKIRIINFLKLFILKTFSNPILTYRCMKLYSKVENK